MQDELNLLRKIHDQKIRGFQDILDGHGKLIDGLVNLSDHTSSIVTQLEELPPQVCKMATQINALEEAQNSIGNLDIPMRFNKIEESIAALTAYSNDVQEKLVDLATTVIGDKDGDDI